MSFGNLTIEADDLDRLYGAVVVANAGPTERTLVRQDVQILNTHTALLLRGLMRLADDRQPLVSSLYGIDGIPILWVIDEAGACRFASEACVKEEGQATIVPFIRGLDAVFRGRKLGHPSLLRDQEWRGRIGGEIFIDDDRIWRISAASGRYSAHHNRTDLHLNNAAALFKQFDITLVPLAGMV